jgi:tetratricopeptide (TPR) repeat protein
MRYFKFGPGRRFAAAAFLLLFPNALDAAPPGASSGAPILCERGFAYSKTRQTCLELGARAFAPGELYEQGEALARAGHYQRALDVLEAIDRQNDPKVLTMKGFSLRKLGKIEDGIRAYLQALALDPGNAEAREYLGEGYVETGRRDLALKELASIEAICGNRHCEPYRDLAAAITGAGEPE